MMSPTVALTSSTVSRYVVLVGTLLPGIGLLLVVLTYGFGCRLGVSGEPIEAGLSWCPRARRRGRRPSGDDCQRCGRAIFAFREFARATGLYRDWWTTAASTLASRRWRRARSLKSGDTFPAAWPLHGTARLRRVSRPCRIARPLTGPTSELRAGRAGFIYMGWMFSHVGFLANSPHAYGYLLFLLLAVEGSDVAASHQENFSGGESFATRSVRTRRGAVRWGSRVFDGRWPLWFSFPHFGWVQLYSPA
jgi:hypothetical protein